MPAYFDLIPGYFPELSPKQLFQFEQLWSFYQKWNLKINVISRKDIDELYLRHVLHSLAIAKVFTFQKGAKVLDVGTGGGFPGIPLSIFYPEVDFTLIDSTGKKIKVVKQGIKEIQINNAEVIQIRAEEVDDQFDFIVSRAVTGIRKFVSWVESNIRENSSPEKDNGIILLKGGDLREELNAVKWDNKIYKISDIFTEDFFKTKKLVHLTKRL